VVPVQSDTPYQRLRRLILDGSYPPGSRLTELELAAVLEVSRTPVREAFRALAADGLVETAGRGVRVVELGPDELRDAYLVRAALEALTAELAAERQRQGRIAPAELADLERLAALTDEVTAAGRIVEAVRLNRRFHRRVAELAANPVALQTLDRLWDRIQVSTQSTLRPVGRVGQVAEQHRELLAALAAGDAEAAAAAARRHVLDTCATTRDEE
jgi:DNA-binding GntR family transcriptional regulator